MRQKGSGSRKKKDGEELGGVDRGETVIRTYCMRKESCFNKRKNFKIFFIVKHYTHARKVQKKTSQDLFPFNTYL